MSQQALAIACVHGRFQPFHLEHLEYLQAARKRARTVLVGITNYCRERALIVGAPAHRCGEDSNPFTYYERMQMISAALLEAGWREGEFAFSPFPIEHPDLLPEFVPSSVLCLTTICEDWNRLKIATLLERGYPVEVLWERKKRISGMEVRRRLHLGDQTWRDLVPAAVSRLIETHPAAGRRVDTFPGSAS